ncbi:MAG TPA: ribose-5-phosphate isomerase RpiA [Ignavibacteria bacterium]|nr:ribose-5-phosphate isomerase RpiA [Ignavibacteria bacterium]
MTQEEKNIGKKSAAEKAVEFVKDRMTVGLGSGSTVFFAIKKLGEQVRGGLNIKTVSTSDTTTQLAQSEGIKLTSIDEAGEIDLTIDGADEVDRSFNGIKGGGGALLFEKIVALSSKKNIWIVDSTKLVDKLGKFPLPVEIIPFGYKRVFKLIEEMNLNPVIRKKNDEFYFTDSGNLIFDLHIGEVRDPEDMDKELKLINGVVETGLFINIADVIISGRNNSTEIINK